VRPERLGSRVVARGAEPASDRAVALLLPPPIKRAVHYGKFTNWVLSGEYFFDVNPPFGKWVIALVASLLGFDPTLDAFEKPGSAISSQAQTFAGRAPAALFGSLTVPVFYWLCRQLRLSGASAFLGASLILFDSMHVVQSRLIMVDSLLVFLTCAGLLCALLLWDAKQVCLRGEGRRHAREVVTVAALLVATGILCGLSVSVRWTAFATPAVVLIVSVFGVPPFCLCPLNWLEVVVLGASMFAAYYGSFAVFLMTLHKSGTGNAFMSNSFQMCLAGSRAALDAAAAGTDAACRMSMWSRFVELNQKVRPRPAPLPDTLRPAVPSPLRRVPARSLIVRLPLTSSASPPSRARVTDLCVLEGHSGLGQVGLALVAMVRKLARRPVLPQFADGRWHGRVARQVGGDRLRADESGHGGCH
jgi:hypothetical protein